MRRRLGCRLEDGANWPTNRRRHHRRHRRHHRCGGPGPRRPGSDGRRAESRSSPIWPCRQPRHRVTNPKPRDRPVSRSAITLASVISPNCANASCSPSSVVSQLRLPTNSFLLIAPIFLSGPSSFRTLPCLSVPANRSFAKLPAAPAAASQAPQYTWNFEVFSYAALNQVTSD